MRQRVAAFGQRTAALRNRFRPSERRANQLWKAVIVFAIVLPIVSMAVEMVRQSPFSAIVFAVIIIIWGVVMWWGWRQGTSGRADAAPKAPTMAAKASASPQQQAKQSTATDGRKTGGRQAGRK